MLGIKADDGFGLPLQGTNQKEWYAADLEDVCNVAVIIDIDAVEVHLTIVMLRYLPQHRFKSLAWLAPVSIEVHNDGPRTAHGPVYSAVVSNELLELLLVDGVDSIDGIEVYVIIALGLGSEGERQDQ